MSQIDYGRLAAIESALGGRGAINTAHETGQSLVGGGGGGAAIQSALITLLADPVATVGGVPFDTIVHDDIGVHLAMPQGLILLPKGYYFVQALIDSVQIGDGSTGPAPNDMYTVKLDLGALAYDDGPVVHVGPKTFHGTTADQVQLQSRPHTANGFFESGSVDLTIAGLAHHPFLVCVLSVSAEDATSGVTVDMTPTNPQVFIHRLGDKA